MELHLIAEDLREHEWYERLLAGTIADVEAFAARWAAFADYVETLARGAGDDRRPR